MEATKKSGGKREGQKYKSLLVWDILLKKTDENHALRLVDIQKHLENYGISAERHSIKRDIEDVLALLNKEIDFDQDELEIERLYRLLMWLRISRNSLTTSPADMKLNKR